MNRSLNKLFIIMMLFGGLSFSGCTALVSPYNSEFQCPTMDKGKCVSVKTAYDESVDNPLVRDGDEPCSCDEDKNKDKDKDKKKDSGQLSPGLAPVNRGPKSDFENAMYQRLASLISEPTPPLVAPPEVMRVLILSYTGSDNNLFSFRYVYFFATDPKWIFSTTDGGN